MLLFMLSFLSRIYFIFKYMEIDYEADSYMHFLGSQAWIHDPVKNFDFLINWWYKPLFTLISGIVLKMTFENIIVIKLMNTLIWLGVLYLVYLVAKEHKLSKEAIFFSVFFTSFSFLAIHSSISALTEPLFTLLIVAAYYFLLKDQFTLSALSVSASLLCRMEGIIFIFIWSFYFIFHKKYIYIILLSTFSLLWNIIGFLKTGSILYIITNYPFASTTSVYGSGTVYYYFINLLKYEPLIFLLFILSLFLYKKDYLFLKICILTFLTFHIIIWKYGLLGSAGFMRYLVPIIPLMSILAAASLVKVVKFKSNLRYAIYIIIVLSQITYSLTLKSPTSDFVNNDMIEVGNFIVSLDQNNTLVAENPAILYFSRKVLGINAAQWFDRVSGAQEIDPNLIKSDNIYFVHDGWCKTDIWYFLKDPNFKLLRNFSNIYVFEGKSY